jgi:hypothetical protein
MAALVLSAERPFVDRGGGVDPQAQVFRAALNFHF